jgi:hypothetical protein
MTQSVGTNDESVKLNFCNLLNFERDTTNLRGTLVENVNKVKNKPTLMHNAYTIISYSVLPPSTEKYCDEIFLFEFSEKLCARQ